MSDSTVSGSPVRGGRRGPYLSLLIMAVVLPWTHSSSHGLPGESRSNDAPLRCPDCGALARKRPDGKYACANGHVFTKKYYDKKEREREERA